MDKAKYEMTIKVWWAEAGYWVAHLETPTQTVQGYDKESQKQAVRNALTGIR